MSAPLIMFLIFIAITLAITYWASKRSSGVQRLFCRQPPDSQPGRTALPLPATT